MNTTIVKKVLIALVVLAMATMMAACDLSAAVDTGSSVEVAMGGIDGARKPTISFANDANWVSIKVVNSSGLQVGTGELAKTADGWKGKISVSETGTMTFTASAGIPIS